MRFRSSFLFLTVFSLAPLASAQSLQNTEFHLDYSSSGVTSLKRVHDKYDTDYIARGRTLGDLLIRYRSVGEKELEEGVCGSSQPRDSPSSDHAVTFTIGELVPTLASLARPSASIRAQTLFALSDDLQPQNSRDDDIPRFFWYGRNGTPEWVQYDFPEPKEVHSVQLYWALHDEDQNPGKLPESWRLLYRDGEDWKEVTSPAPIP